MKLQINGKDTAGTEWPDEVKAKWEQHIAPLFQPDQRCSLANYYAPRPWKNEYDRGSREEGFTYIVQPGNRVCFKVISTADHIVAQPDAYGLKFLAGNPLPPGTRLEGSV